MVETVEYRVQRRDTLSNIVARAGFPARDWRRIYNAPYNRRFKRAHPDPNLILPGAILMLPRYSPQVIRDLAAKTQRARVSVERMESNADRLRDVVSQVRRRLRQRQGDTALPSRDELAPRAERFERMADQVIRHCREADCPQARRAAEALRDAAMWLREEARNGRDEPIDAMAARLETLEGMLEMRQAPLSRSLRRLRALEAELARALRDPYR